MVTLFLYYHSTALCISKADIRASVICYLGRFVYLVCYVSKPSWASHSISVVYPIVFISHLFSLVAYAHSQRLRDS